MANGQPIRCANVVVADSWRSVGENLRAVGLVAIFAAHEPTGREHCFDAAAEEPAISRKSPRRCARWAAVAAAAMTKSFFMSRSRSKLSAFAIR
jgi:hypothetical protein